MQLGFTFYPKDWWTSDSFYTLSPFERYIYLELLFMMYDNGGSVTSNKAMVERRLSATIKDEVWTNVTNLMVKEDDNLTHKSVNKRLAKAIANRQNGLLGGRPKAGIEKPKKPSLETQKNPPYKEKEKEKENIKGKEEKNNTEVPAHTHSNEDVEAFTKFQDWIKKYAPRVNQLKQPITINEFFKLKEKLSNEVVRKLLIAMHNYKPLLSKSVSAYLTILNWSKREEVEKVPASAQEKRMVL